MLLKIIHGELVGGVGILRVPLNQCFNLSAESNDLSPNLSPGAASRLRNTVARLINTPFDVSFLPGPAARADFLPAP